ncbi:hypothetical protein ACFUV2_09265 [Streptomyces pilosus]
MITILLVITICAAVLTPEVAVSAAALTQAAATLWIALHRRPSHMTAEG